jgi:formylglycine-generating enzyme required for sulfatase activity
MKNLKLLIAVAALFASSSGFANNISVSGVTLTNKDEVANTMKITFTVAWQNSWRTSQNENNYDGAWIFIKYRLNGLIWRHCSINTSGFVPDNDATIRIPNDNNGTGRGAFIYRNQNGLGDVTFVKNELIWNYGADSVEDNATVEIQVFALEMVYIPEGPYYLGSTGSELNCFRKGTSTEAYQVTAAANSPAGIPINNTTGLNFNGKGSSVTNSIPPTFPNGYNAFWVMKYECTQQQYADFLNNIGSEQATQISTGTGIFTLENFTGQHPGLQPLHENEPMGKYYIQQVLAVADWSGLRPISEMEFEKACRGANILPTADEYAWGTTAETVLTAVTFPQLENEAVATVNANAIFATSPINRPVRVGIFARPSGSSRQLSGGTFYGVMNMSDNMYETTIYSGNSQGQAMLATVYGNGDLNPNGTSNEPNWQDISAFGIRGSSYAGDKNLGRISYRGLADYLGNNINIARGIRLVRMAP